MRASAPSGPSALHSELAVHTTALVCFHKQLQSLIGAFPDQYTARSSIEHSRKSPTLSPPPQLPGYSGAAEKQCGSPAAGPKVSRSLPLHLVLGLRQQLLPLDSLLA